MGRVGGSYPLVRGRSHGGTAALNACGEATPFGDGDCISHARKPTETELLDWVARRGYLHVQFVDQRHVLAREGPHGVEHTIVVMAWVVTEIGRRESEGPTLRDALARAMQQWG